MREIVRITLSEAEKKLSHSKQDPFTGNKQPERDEATVVFKSRAISAKKTRKIVSLPITTNTERIRTGNSFVKRNVSNDAVRDTRDPITVEIKKKASDLFLPSLERLREDDHSEWTTWVEIVTPFFMRVALRAVKDETTAEDIIQATWAKISKAVHEDRVKQPKFINTWARSVFYNNLSDYFRRKKNEHFVDFEEKESFLESIPAQMEDIGDIIANHDAFRRLLPFIDQLSPEHAEQIIYLLEDWSIKDIAQELGIAEGAVKNRRTRALRGIKELIASRDTIEESTDNEDDTQKEEEKKWLRTLMHKKMTVGESIRFLRLAEGLSLSKFSEKVNCHSHLLDKVEDGREKPWLFTINKIIEGKSMIKAGLLAQFLRMKINRDRPMTLQELQNCSKGQLIRYLRILTGFTIKEMGEKLGYAETTWSQIERDIQPVHTKTIDAFMKHLSPSYSEDAVNSALFEIITKKMEGNDTEIARSTYKKAISGRYLFAEHLKTIDPYPSEVLTEYKLLLSKMEVSDSFGEKMQFLRKYKGIPSIAKLSRMVEMNEHSISGIETKGKIPKDYILARIMKGLGYDIHHPLTWHMLDLSDKERKVRDSQVAQKRAAKKT